MKRERVVSRLSSARAASARPTETTRPVVSFSKTRTMRVSQASRVGTTALGGVADPAEAVIADRAGAAPRGRRVEGEAAGVVAGEHGADSVEDRRLAGPRRPHQGSRSPDPDLFAADQVPIREGDVGEPIHRAGKSSMEMTEPRHGRGGPTMQVDGPVVLFFTGGDVGASSRATHVSCEILTPMWMPPLIGLSRHRPFAPLPRRGPAPSRNRVRAPRHRERSSAA